MHGRAKGGPRKRQGVNCEGACQDWQDVEVVGEVEGSGTRVENISGHNVKHPGGNAREADGGSEENKIGREKMEKGKLGQVGVSGSQRAGSIWA